MDGRSSRISRMHRVVGANSALTLLCILHFVSHSFARIPYTPSSLLYSFQQNSSFAYLLRPADSSRDRTEFLSLDVSKALDSANPSYTVLLNEAPFHNGGEIAPYVSAIDQDGVVMVYSGDCWGSKNSPAFWTFEPNSGSPSGNGTWRALPVHGEEGQTSPIHGPNYLSAGFAYAPSNTTKSSFFAFGGMCPCQSDTNGSWVTAANYSQLMTVLDLSRTENRYQATTAGDRAPPIPEAGFTITPLQATYSYSEYERRQQQSFLLIGGHTQQAFLNMSELAIFSAPQNSWSFVTVGSGTDAAFIEPRSGHTAVLSPDGSKVIVFGGWVGNTSVPANPQLAVLEIGGGFVGAGEWAWRVPSMESNGIPEGSGLYGHGATMLPGGVMMIAGGYEIPQLSKRSGTGPQLNSQTLLYDVGSDTWQSSYENPNLTSARTNGESSTSSDQSSSSRKTGLGVGIGLGLPAAAGLAAFAFYFCRRRRARENRDKEIRKLALGAQRAHFWGRDDPEMASSIRNPSSTRESFNSDYPWCSNKTQSLGRKPDWKDQGDATAERTGLLVGVYTPKKLNGPTLNAGVYRAPYYDYRRGDTAGDIHPIDERDEDEAHRTERTDTHDSAESLTEQAYVTARNTRVGGVHPPDLLHSGAATGIAVGKDGRLSPDKDGRISSSLSDSSASSKSTKSARLSPTILTNTPVSTADGTTLLDKSAFVSRHNRDAVGSQDSSTSTTSAFEKRYSSDSYSTAHSTLSQRQAEGEYLLQEGPKQPLSLNPFSTKSATSTRPKASEWIGGIRRVLSVSRKPPAVLEGSSAVSGPSSTESKGTATRTLTTGPLIPRRSVSASAELFRRKQGAKDWGVGNRVSQETGFQTARSTRDDFGLDGLIDLDSDEDWDVEGAAEGRRVQVTFTVPREKLRVVNATAGDMDDLSEKSVSRSNSSS
ncbi:uncharacterized protein BJX67DRAFT_208725 [Aspergillus lucknowensis]|uniref:Galactose oxidase n=1 Tax=Aspergillus lucknowensis TaxID=176173 RepID=A0ABR4LJA0_9EURO